MVPNVEEGWCIAGAKKAHTVQVQLISFTNNKTVITHELFVLHEGHAALDRFPPAKSKCLQDSHILSQVIGDRPVNLAED